MLFKLNKIHLSGSEVLPIIEGGKGVGVTNGITAGNFAKNDAIGTFSGVNADFYDENGNRVPQTYKSTLTRKEKFEELINYAIKGAIAQAKIAHDIANGKGRIHMNILWEAGGAKRVIEGVFQKTKGLIHGITCGAGLPYDLAEIATKYKVYYYPIVSSTRAFSILWKRAYSKLGKFLGGVVYEDPWLAGGHVGLSNKENPLIAEEPYEKLTTLRKFMNSVGLNDAAIIMAGGVWELSCWKDFIDNKEIGKIAFQFGTRPLLTQESPISNAWKQKLLNLKKEDILLNRFSPTGLPSIAIKNDFLKNLIERSKRQVAYSLHSTDKYSVPLTNKRGHSIYISEENKTDVFKWQADGFNIYLKTPDHTVVFVTQSEALKIREDQKNCKGCLSSCVFSNWSDHLPGNTTGAHTDPRSFCIQNTLQDVIHNGDVEKNLLFSGKSGYRFSEDPLYRNNHIPTIKELITKICNGE